MSLETPTVVDFLLARVGEDEVVAREAIAERDAANARGVFIHPAEPEPDLLMAWSDHPGPGVCLVGPERVLAECHAKRRIIEFHQSWPVLVETPPVVETPRLCDDLNSVTLSMSRQMMWMTEKAYRDQFGTEPPATRIILAMAAVYADHVHYREEWAL